MANTPHNGTDTNFTPQRPKLNLKPRDPNAAARLAAEREHSLGKNPFGDAKPREQVIAQRVGRSEEDILKDEVKKEKLHLRLSASQLEEKRSMEAAVKEIEDQIEAEEDESKKDVLRVEAAARQLKLDGLMERFAKVTLETALSGEAPRVSQLRRQHAEAAMQVAPFPAQLTQYSQRYNPTRDQYGTPTHRAGGRGGRYDQYQVGGRGGGSRGGGRAGAGGQLPDWAKEEEYGGNGPYARGGYNYTDAGEAAFYDQSPPSGYAYAGGRGRGRSRGRGRDAQAHGVPQGAYFDSFAGQTGGYGGPGRGVGGEIEFDTFSGQDRY